MIISASRRTDIPAFYSDWLANRIKDGFCTVQNPFNKNVISVVDLRSQNVDVIVFWTRNAQPLWKKISHINELGYDYYFQYTINNYPKPFEKSPHSLTNVIKNFQDISDTIGPDRIIWRYDPIVFTSELNYNFHINNFQNLLDRLKGYTNRLVISLIDDYRKTQNRLKSNDIVYTKNQLFHPQTLELLAEISKRCSKCNIEVQTCAENIDLISLGIKKGKCIDDELIYKLFQKKVSYKKDVGQRELCLCNQSRDIGYNNTCINGCEYCYSTINQSLAVKNYKSHDPNFPSILHHDIDEKLQQKIDEILSNSKPTQLDLF